ncbi:retrotransposon protein, putative, ty1-copia subclass [Tanacetum coccineum]
MYYQWDKLNTLEQPLPPAPVAPAGQHVAPEILAAHTAWELKTLFAQQAEQELLQTTCDFHVCKQEEGQSVSSYVLKMKGYIDNLERLGHPVTLGLVLHEQTLNLPKNNTPALHAIRAGKVQKGHWKRNCPQYLAELLKKKKNAAFELWDGIFEIDLSNSYANESSIYTVSNKRAKLDLDSALLWHCRLGHISKKRIEKLQHDGLLNSTDLRAFEKCIPCMSGKMARKPYTHQVERAKDLLGLIHTDVCGPFKITSRQGASYFVTFTDDFSRYGYVYLLKHKHEVFETFKVFQKEVENQLGKTIKSLRSDRGGEYMSQEFLDHLKDHGIIAHRTPPYTPQHNGDYALETAARILNMVPTKKVEKTPYEVWHGQAPKLSYLKVWGCEALVKRDTLTKPDKLEPRSIKWYNVIGYPKENNGLFFLLPTREQSPLLLGMLNS